MKVLPPAPARVHFIGIGGISMSGLAQVLHAWGYRVSGSDSTPTPLTRQMQGLGIEIAIGHDDGTLASSSDVLVTTLRAAVNAPVEVAAAAANGAMTVKRGELIGMLAEEKISVAVAGTHGKSTTSGMVTIGLRALGQDPTYALGAVLAQTGRTVAPGTGPYLVAEADEFDRAFHFLRPNVAIITSVAFDHPDIYADQEEYDQAFVDFARGVPNDGRLILPADDAGAQRVSAALGETALEIVTFGASDADWVVAHDGEGWTMRSRAGRVVPIRPTIPGDHNVRNLVAAALAIERLGFDIGAAVDAVCTFAGIQRRFELKGVANDVVVIDDYAHHPDEIRVTIATARSAYPGRRVVAVHQPHTYSRTKALLEPFAASLDEADLALIMEIYPSSETDTLGIASDDLVRRMKSGAIASGSAGETVDLLAEAVRPGDVVLTLGAGSITDVGPGVLERLQARVAPAVVVASAAPKIVEGADLSLVTTMRVGGKADYLIRAATPDDIVAAVRWAHDRSLPVTMIGGGSNLLISDSGIRGVAIIAKSSGDRALRLVEAVDEGDTVLVTVPSNAPISAVGRYCAEQGWSGMDWAVGLPGQIGGATVNNAGAHGTELKDYLVSIELLRPDGDVESRDGSWLRATYRMTRIKGAPRPRPWTVLRSTFRLPKGNREALIALADDHAAFRKRTQPTGACSGSTFANPEGDYAGRLLEAAGMKGYRIGAMEFSPKHANWVVNTGGGTAADAWALIMHGQEVVRERFGITLRPEIERVGAGESWETPHDPIVTEE